MGIKGLGGFMVLLGLGGDGLFFMFFIFFLIIFLRFLIIVWNLLFWGFESEFEYVDNIYRYCKSCNKIIIGFSLKIVNVFEWSINKLRFKLKLLFNYINFLDLLWKIVSKIMMNFRYFILMFYYV